MKPLIVPFFISHRGCPHRCIFCDQRRISGREGSLPTAAEMLETISAYAASGKGRAMEVAFYGGSFTSLDRGDQERLLLPLQPLLAAGTVGSVRLSTRPDAVDADCTAFLRAHGVRTVELGVQSMDDRVLEKADRGHTSADVERAAFCLRDAGIAFGAQLMPGLPVDTTECSLASLQRVLALGPACLRIYPTVVVEGTHLADLYRAGSYIPLGLPEAVSLCKKMLREAMKAEVPVIRMGLQPTAELEAPGAVLAGPWHPAFRQLVEGELMFDLLERLTAGLLAGTRVAAACAPARVSDVTGQRRANLNRLRERHGIEVERVAACASLAPDALEITHAGGTLAGSLLEC